MNKTKTISIEDAIDRLQTMLFLHTNNCGFIDFNSDDEEEIEQAECWLETKQTLELAIKTLKEKEK